MKNQTIKRFLAGTLAAAMVLGMAACGDTGDTDGRVQSSSGSRTPEPGSSSVQGAENTPAPQEPLKLSILVVGSDQQGGQGEYDRLVSDINEYTNADVEWIFTSQSEYDEQMTLIYAANKFPTVLAVNKKDAAFVNACTKSDTFWDVTDYIDDYPNLATMPQVVRDNASVNGRLYGIPRSRDLVRNAVGMRLDWLDNLGLKTPETIDDFYKMLYAFTYDDPDGNGQDDTYGLGICSYEGPWNIMQLWFGAPNKWGVDGDGNLVPEHMTKEYREALKWFRQIYSEGLVNPDFRELPAEQWDVILRGGVAGCSMDTFGRFRKNQDYFDKEGISARTVVIPAPDGGYGIRCLPTDGYGGLLAISKKEVKTEEELKRVLQFLNDLNDAEILDKIDWGYEGISYYITPEGYYQLYTEEERTALGVVAGGRTGFNQALAYFNTQEQKDKRIKSVPETGMKAEETQYFKDSIQYAVPNIALSYLSSSATYLEKGSNLDKMIANARLDYITGVIDDAGLEEIFSQWLKAGGQDVIDELNALYHANN